jgi:uncharacterized membrane protein YgaE (UPF0421/DUF939 family)
MPRNGIPIVFTARFFFIAIAVGVIAAALVLAMFIPLTQKLLGKKV